MSVRLPDCLDLIACAPKGIDKLRELILELAVRGKLVEQDPDDEPASELLKRIAEERKRLEAEGVCKKSKAMPLSNEEGGPFKVPAGWTWVRLAEIGHDWGQKIPDASFTYVDVSAIDNTRGTISSPAVVAPADAPSRARKIVRRGTVIYSTVRPYLLNTAVIDRDLTPAPIASTAFAVIHPLAGLSSQFIFWYLRSPVFVRYVESVQTGIAYPAVNDSQFFSGLFPLPPVAEQHRIVAKVDELMALCDRLEAEQADSGTAHDRLVETLLGTLTQSADANELAANWRRLAGHFGTLFTTDASVDTLKQTVLQLAVMGKLVPQDPNDEPASELVKRITKARAQLEADGVCKKSKATPLVGDDEQAFVLPPSWDWIRLGQIGDWGAGATPLRSNPRYYGGTIPWFKSGELTSDFISESEEHVTELALKECSLRQNKVGDVLIAMYGATIGKTAILATGATTNQAVCACTPNTGVFNRYLLLLLKALKSNFVGQGAGGAQPNISREKIIATVTALPPEPEQHRIVAKVDELMALCDRLKADLVDSRSRQARLADTLIAAALEAA